MRGEFYAHRIAFAHASDAFHDMLDTGVLDPPVPEGQTTGRYTIEMEDMEYEAGLGRLWCVYITLIEPQGASHDELNHPSTPLDCDL